MPRTVKEKPCKPCEVFKVALAHSLLGQAKLNRLRELAQRVKDVPGAIAEIGVYKGGSAYLLARENPKKTVYLFDTFEGIPMSGANDVHGIGDFGDTSFDAVQELLKGDANAQLQPGLFPETAAGLENETYSFVHVDGDQEQTTRDALEYFWPRLADGGIMLFDDYEWKHCPGVALAVNEFAEKIGLAVQRPGQHQAYLEKLAPGVTPKSVPGDTLKIRVWAKGIGDAICGYYAACGAASAGYQVEYYNRHPGWFCRVSHPGVTVLPYAESEGVLDISTRYGEQLAQANRHGARSRKQWYCDNLARALGVKSIEPCAPAHVDTSVHEKRLDDEWSDYVIFAPFSAYPSRHWLDANWRYLAKLFRDANVRVLVLHKPGGGAQCRELFGASAGVTWICGKQMDWIADVTQDARAVIGIDSGLTHYAAMLKVPTFAIHSHLPRELLFSQTDAVSLMPEQSACSPCAWQTERGYSSHCKALCSALASVSPHRVFEAVMNLK
jgi:predicted O-methyltransferase YrrM